MAESVTRIGRSFTFVLLLGATMRFVVAAAAGIAEWVQGDGFRYPDASQRVGDVLLQFGAAGDGVGVVLAVGAAALVAWLLLSGEGADRMRTALGVVLGLTAVSAFVQALAYTLLFTVEPGLNLWSRLILGSGQALIYAGLALGGLAAMRRFDALAVVPAVERLDDEPLVFAVDRKSGEVWAYFSVDEAERRTHVYLVADDELAFFTDAGDVLAATAENDRVVLRPTPVNDRDTLLSALREFVTRRGIATGQVDADDPTAYAGPINEWQWLELWPGWLRWLGRIVRGR
jgi:hypothetical protein